MEKWIAKILKNDDLKQIVKENEAVLAENKKLISVSFAALIQTLKSDPDMIKLIQNMPTANTECKDNSDNITKYLEANKHVLVDLTEKQYKNIVDVFTNNAISNIANASSFNSTLSLPSSSSSPIRHYHRRSRHLHS
jgi:hypothetical protein